MSRSALVVTETSTHGPTALTSYLVSLQLRAPSGAVEMASFPRGPIRSTLREPLVRTHLIGLALFNLYGLFTDGAIRTPRAFGHLCGEFLRWVHFASWERAIVLYGSRRCVILSVQF